MKVLDLFVMSKLCASKKEAKRMLSSGTLKINNVIIDDASLDVAHIEGKVIIGKYIDNGFIIHESCLIK